MTSLTNAPLSLNHRIEAASERASSITFISGDAGVTVPWSELHRDARAMAAALQQLGVSTGDHVAVLGPTTQNLVTLIQATWLAGATIVVLPLPMRLASIEEFVAQTRARVKRADIELLVIDEQLAPFVDDHPDDPRRIVLDELAGIAAEVGASSWKRVDDDPDRLAILQFTSGSTSEPKGVMLPHHVVCSNLDGLTQTGRLQDDDVFVSWLPLYHDMGLVGLLGTPMSFGVDLVLGAPQDFTARPARWMEWLDTYGGTVTAGPNFAYALAARALRRKDATYDLSRLRIALNGAEPIDADSVRAFVDAAAPHGMRPGAVFNAFGMAEVAIAGTFPEPLAGLQTDRVDNRVLESENYAAPVEEGAEHAKEYALLGTAIPGLELRVVDPSDDRVLADREVGELQIRGTSVTPGYYKNPEATQALFRDGWLATGDLAYLLDGQLVICGRIKDVIIVGGRNIFPEDIERAAAAIDGVRAGNVIAFGVEGRGGHESMVVVAETNASSADAEDLDRVRKEVHAAAKRVTGLPPQEIVLVAPGALPKTSSGKLQRSLCRQRFQADELARADA
jgi:fatty-acyl-CoA synthase